MDRRTAILDGALEVLAEQGMRGLTHRAVDAAAGLPPGSTSYYFRSRGALVTGCVQRLVERDLTDRVATVDAAVPTAGQDLPAVLAAALTTVGVRMATVERQRTLARYELSLAAVSRPRPARRTGARAATRPGDGGPRCWPGPVSPNRMRRPRSWRRCSTGWCSRLWCAGHRTPTRCPHGCDRRWSGG